MTDEPARVGNVLYPVPDVAAAVAFYRDGLGLAVKFQDGSRYAALDGGGVTFAIAAAEESVAGPGPAASFKVTDLACRCGTAYRSRGNPYHRLLPRARTRSGQRSAIRPAIPS